MNVQTVLTVAGAIAVVIVKTIALAKKEGLIGNDIDIPNDIDPMEDK